MLDLSKYDGHTIGPWTDYGHEDGDIYGAKQERFMTKPIIECDSGVYGPHNSDRRLIIDAPILLAELKRVYNVLYGKEYP